MAATKLTAFQRLATQCAGRSLVVVDWEKRVIYSDAGEVALPPFATKEEVAQLVRALAPKTGHRPSVVHLNF